jgi:hypothetical protein
MFDDSIPQASCLVIGKRVDLAYAKGIAREAIPLNTARRQPTTKAVRSLRQKLYACLLSARSVSLQAGTGMSTPCSDARPSRRA